MSLIVLMGYSNTRNSLLLIHQDVRHVQVIKTKLEHVAQKLSIYINM